MLSRIILLFSTVLVCSAQAFAQTTGPASPDAPHPEQPPLFTANTTSLACYFKNSAGKVTWKWGLAPGNQWYQLTGSWTKTQYTKLQKFFTETASGPLDDACKRSRTYYKLNGYSVFAYFAADKSLGYNYPIVSCGVELYPQY